MKSTAFYLAFFVKKLWTFAAIFLVFVAASISILRFSLPYMDEQKHRVEEWLSSQYGVELEIGQLSAGWSGIGPTLVLKNVHLKQSAQSPIDLNVAETQVELDFWGSVLARQIKSTRFELQGMIMAVDLDQIQQSESDFPIVEALESLFLEQLQQFSVSDSRVEVRSLRDEQLIQIEQLSWVNKDLRHQGVGQLRVVELAANSAYFALDLYGGKDDLNGTFYAKAEELDMSPWLNELVKTENKLTESRANFTFWAGINNGLVDGIQVQLDSSEFAWETPESEVSAAILGGDIVAVPDQLGWHINVDNLAMQSAGQSLISSWAARVDKQGHTRFHSRMPMDIAAVIPVLPLVLDPQSTKLVSDLDPGARVDSIAVQIGEQAAAQMRFSQLGWQQVGQLPGLQNLTGQINWLGNQGSLTLQGIADRLEIDNLLPNDIMYRNFDLQAYVEAQDGQLAVFVPQVNFESDLVTLSNSLAYRSVDNHLAITSTVSPLDVAQVKQLFPTEAMGRDTRSYLMRALEQGQINGAKLLWNGPTDAFPFEQDQGVFQASVDLTDVHLSFDTSWPTLTELDIQLLFENEGLTMTASRGQLMEVKLSELHAVIPQLADGAVLTIDAIGQAEGTQVTDLMLASSLADSVGEALHNGVNVEGQLQAALNLHIPLSSDDVVATGRVTLDDNDIYLPDLDMRLASANGQVNFVNDKVTLQGVDAELLGQPVTVAFSGEQGKKHDYVADVEVAGDWQVAPLVASYVPGLSEHLEGHSSWTAKVGLELGADDFAYTLELNSALEGVGSILPTPFYKATDSALPLIIRSEGNNQASTVKATLGDDVQFDGILPHKELQFSRAHLALGDSDIVGMGLGFSISADLPLVDFSAWYSAIAAMVGELPESENPILGEPQRIYVNAGAMLVAGQKIDQLELTAKHSTKDWLLEFKADQAIASVTLYDDWLNKGIEVQADFINLGEWEGEPQKMDTASLTQLPPITFECKQCKVHGKDLGKVDFELVRAKSGMRIESLRMNNSNGLLYASGDWFMGEAGSSTALQGKLSSPDFGAFLKGFGFDAGIKDSKANFDFDLSWQDAPFEFNFASLNGGVDWNLTDGYLTDVSDKGVRVFSFLSLQSLVRKLSLDFRDVFAKGFFYDKMRGSFQITNGRADTQDSVIDGAAGEMTIAGITDLNTRQLNYEIGFTPNVTSSLPLIVYWLSNTNPATAIAALALDQVLTEAKVISNVRYSVTGSLEEPVLMELDRKSKKISLPAKTDPVDKPDTSDAGQNTAPLPVLDERVTLEVSDG